MDRGRIDNKRDSCKDDNKQNFGTSTAIETPALLATTSARRKEKAALKKERDFKNVCGYPEVEESWRRLRIQTSFANAKQQPKNLMKLS
jgi:7-keto-8-aminopelargonate synthetase-like enzyme